MASIWQQTAKSRGEGGDYDLPPEGNQPARLVALVDLGTHQREYQGKREWKRKVALVWELVEAPGRPLLIRDFTLSLHENAALREWVDAWRGKSLKEGEDLDLSTLLGSAGMVHVEHATSKKSNKTFGRIKGVGSVPTLKGKPIEIEEPEHEPVAWSLDEDDGDPPDWLPYLYGRPVAEHVEESRERSGGEDDEDEYSPEESGEKQDIPF